MELTPVHTLNFSGVFSTSKRTIKANYYHFLALSLFFLPLSISLIIPSTLTLSDHNFPPNHHVIIFQLLYILIIYISTLCAIATISYSTYHGFAGQQVNFFASLKSLTSSIFPIIYTAIVAHALLFLISLTFLLFLQIVITFAQTLGFAIDYNSVTFTSLSIVVIATLIVIIIYFHVNWCLAFMVVVGESKWGFAALRRSSYLVKGMRSVSLLLLLFLGIFSGIFVCFYSDTVYHPGLSGQSFMPFRMLIATFLLILVFLRSTAANSVLYMYCKALHGELALEIDDEGFDYINLPADDEKVPLIVSVVAA